MIQYEFGQLEVKTLVKDKPDYEQVKLFRDTYKDLESVYDTFPKLCGLSTTEYWALLMIHEGISTQHGICEHLSLSRQTVNSAFKQLRNRGLIRLEVMDEDLRTKQVFLTEEGEKFVKKEISHMHKLEEDVWKKMSHEEQKQLTELIYKYKTLLSAAIQNYRNKSE